MLKKIIVVIYLLLFSVVTSAATVVTLSPVIGEEVGNNTTYWSGIYVYKVNGREMILTSTGPYAPTTIMYPGCNDCVMYSRQEILNGTAPGTYADDNRYGYAAQIFTVMILGYNPPDPLWVASGDEVMWDVLWGNNTLWDSANQIADPNIGVTYKDVYNTFFPLTQDYDYSSFMSVIASPTDQIAPFLVYGGDTLTIPLPPAVWLFGSGILGLIGVAQIKKR